MSANSHFIQRTHWPLATEARYLGPHEDTSPIDVTLVMRRKGAHPQAAAWPHAAAVQRQDFDNAYGANPHDVDQLRGFARQHGLEETGCDTCRRVMHLRGTPQAMQRAFGVELGRYQLLPSGDTVMGSRHPPALSSAISSSVIAVLGLDRRPVARPHFLRPMAKPSAAYTPMQIGQLYQFPTGTDGTGQTIAVIELGGAFKKTDFTQYFKALGFKKTPSVTTVSVAGGKSRSGAADAEVMLDAEVIGALAPSAKIVIYFAPNTDQGFYEAISQAAHDTKHKPSVISISWGGPEDSWSASTLAAMESALQDAAALGLTITAASGDSGSGDGEADGQPHVDYPASSVYTLGCGGTRLDANGATIASETVWNETATNEGATGGGVSMDYARPAYQQKAGVPTAPGGFVGRGVPDVAGNADPMTGYQVRVDGQNQVIGGTSAVAPLWAALVARFNQSLGAPLGDAHAALYQVNGGAFRDITHGNNGAYQAGKGWDACTGLGTPNGQAMLQALKALQPAA
ncbi:S53 family peptidase [Dyella koreensis]|uniref:Peptidase S53 n=1 Tax=Dyella koreensis TaxID=311235 RepID=A0ABW8K2X7_9GAMM